MSDAAEAYSKTLRSTINRLKQRGTYDHDTIHGIIDSAPIAHVSFNPTSLDDDPFPTILPMLAVTGSYTAPGADLTSPIAVYIHGHSASRFMKFPATRADDPNFDPLPGVPVCVSATHVDGVVLALTPFNCSCNYRSAVVHGYATTVDDPAEKMYALTLLTNNLVPGTWENTRVPPTAAEMQSTTVLRVDIVCASAKIRAWEAGNDKEDLDNMALRDRVWTGVVPMFTSHGIPVPAGENRVLVVPDRLEKFVAAENKKRATYANDVAGRPYIKK
ncbi:hypothetical protein D9619_011123 [Psilocybe cf. subviscida]|uniref:Flavin-nucleotide-binding protein n=1 Tax=Psilocybe cf. subviscida TaxID=2480587 RepID=A0A8H5BK59_9AGAR|nr:hypothetical protein D9619_011123 [Psilocybe cf. subviscida]